MLSERQASAASTSADVFIVGGGPAGLACAIALARLGHSVRVADGMQPPIDKACGEGLMPDTLEALRQLGIDLSAAPDGTPTAPDGTPTAPDGTPTAPDGTPTAQICGIRFLDTDSGTSAQAPFPHEAGAGRGMKRRALHQLLLDQAVGLGVTFSWQTVVQRLTQHESGLATVETNRGSFRAQYVVGADGHQSRIRSAAGLDGAKVSAKRVGLRQHFAVAPWTDFVEVHWSGHGQAYVTPVSAAEVCVAFVAQSKFSGGVAEALTHFPQLSNRLSGATPSDLPRGAITYSRKLRRVTRGNVALLGDASGSVDAVTGEGLSLAFRQALALAHAIHAGELSSYERAHLRMRRMPHLMASTLLLLDRSPFLRRRSIALLASAPRLFQRLLNIHIGQTSWSSRGRLGAAGTPHEEAPQGVISHSLS